MPIIVGFGAGHHWPKGVNRRGPRQLGPSGSVWLPRLLMPPPVVGLPSTPLHWAIVASPRRLRPGRASSLLRAPVPGAVFPARVPVVSIRLGWRPGHATSLAAVPPVSHPSTPLHGLCVAGGQVRRRGRVWIPPALAPQPPGIPATPLRGLFISGAQPRRRGRAWLPPGLAAPAVSAPGSSSIRRPLFVAGPSHRQRAGRVLLPRRSFGPSSGPPSLLARFPGGLLVRRPGEDRTRLTRPGWLQRYTPAPLGGPIVGTGYHVYSNGGSGPINYSSPIATVYGLTWTSGPLAYPDTWKFGVRAFDGFGEEQNLDCAVSIVLDAGGNDISRRPMAPVGLRAFATKAS